MFVKFQDNYLKMKTLKNILLLLASAVFIASCSEKNPDEIPDWREFYPDDGDSDTSSFTSNSAIPSDMVLLYGGGHHRDPYKWDSSRIEDYVLYTDTEGKSSWLFDGFLCLEFKDTGTGGAGVTFITGCYDTDGSALPSAAKSDWEALADYYFEDGGGVNAIEEAISSASQKMGSKPETKRKVVIGIPEPITNYKFSSTATSTTYWGSLNGSELDFSKLSDRVSACKWYIDRVIDNFNAGKYSNVELSGFYWVAEKSTYTNTVMPKVAEYLDEIGMTFNWIPYFNANGFSEWKSFGFDCAYLQPNYFFYDVAESRLDDACSKALALGMGMEMEFDGNACISSSNYKGDRLISYMDKFKEYGVWDSLPLAYYQGSWALKWMKGSSSAADNEMYHKFCTFVTTRPYRDKASE